MRFDNPEPDDVAWLRLRSKLWPHVSRADHLADLKKWIRAKHFACLAYVDDSPIGLVEASTRTDYVNGTSRSPLAFLEGLYVEPSHRRRGIAGALVREVRVWAQARGLTELASDSPLDNTVAHAVHCALGFTETERVVYFAMPVSGA